MDNAIGRRVAIKMMTGGFAENAGLRKRALILHVSAQTRGANVGHQALDATLV